MKKAGLLLLFILSIVSQGFAQDTQESKQKRFTVTGAFFTWGYNRSAYTKSDLHITGTGIDYTIRQAEGKDAPTAFDPEVHLNPTKFTIPQFDFRVGVMVNNSFYISAGWDHMKYKFQNQEYKVDGYIDNALYGSQRIDFDGSAREVSKGFLYFEHTDGLNYIHISIDKPFTVVQTKNNVFNFQVATEFGTGPVCPWTDGILNGKRYRSKSIHFAGWGVNIGLKPRIFLFNEHLFFQGTFRGGYINMWDFIFYSPESDSIDARGKQNFLYREHTLAIGYQFQF